MFGFSFGGNGLLWERAEREREIIKFLFLVSIIKRPPFVSPVQFISNSPSRLGWDHPHPLQVRVGEVSNESQVTVTVRNLELSSLCLISDFSSVGMQNMASLDCNYY
jgi:hypothetical protein